MDLRALLPRSKMSSARRARVRSRADAEALSRGNRWEREVALRRCASPSSVQQRHSKLRPSSPTAVSEKNQSPFSLCRTARTRLCLPPDPVTSPGDRQEAPSLRCPRRRWSFGCGKSGQVNHKEWAEEEGMRRGHPGVSARPLLARCVKP